MPGDPAVLKDPEDVSAVLSVLDLLAAVTVKLPPVWLDNIETWLVQSESQFHLKGVTCSQTKFDYVVQAMSQSEAVKVLDLIRAPPTFNPYQHLKDRLLRMYALMDYVRFEAISSLPLSGDMLTSSLMSKMLALLCSNSRWIFSAITIFCWMLPIRKFSATLLQVLLSFLYYPLRQPPPLYVQPSSPLRNVSPTCSQIFLTSSPPIVSPPLHFVILSATIFTPTLARRFLPKPTASTLTSWLSPKLNFLP